jgi:hypothetical protein
MWRTRVKPSDDLESAHKPDEPKWDVAPRESVLADLRRTLGHDSAERIVEGEATLKHAPKPEEPPPKREGYFRPGGYSGARPADAEGKFLDWRRQATGRDPEPWERNLPDPNMRLDRWVGREMARVGLPSSLKGVVMRMALVAMRDGVDAARRTLIEERRVAEEYRFAIDGILKQIPPLL